MIPVDSPAQVVIVKFNDYQCPPCSQTFDMYKPIKAKWDKEAPGKVKFMTKDFPLEPECNANCKGASTARLRGGRRGPHGAGEGQGEALEDWIFANQPGADARRPQESRRATSAASRSSIAQYPTRAERRPRRHLARRPARRPVRRRRSS